MNKYYVQRAAQLFTPGLYYSGIHRFTKPWYGGLGSILMFHRVVPESKSARIHNHQGLEISPDQLIATINFFKKRDYDFISLDRLPEYQESNRRKFVVFTFDDGYIDNYEIAYPILKKYNVPLTIYVTTGFPDGHAFVWWYLLEDIMLKNSTVAFEMDGRMVEFKTGTSKEKEIAFNKVRSVLAMTDKQKLDYYRSTMFARYKGECAALTNSLSMTWRQIVELSKDPLVTIGAHSINHYPLKSLTLEESKYEMMESKKIIGAHIQKEVDHFCYPIGSYSKREVTLAESCGYHSATTINMSNFFTEHFAQPFAMPRIMINALTTEKLLTLQVNGLLPFIRNKGRKIVT